MTFLWILFVVMLFCVAYLVIDWIVDEIKQRKREREEMEDW